MGEFNSGRSGADCALPQKLQGPLLYLRREAFAAMMERAINPSPAGSKFES